MRSSRELSNVCGYFFCATCIGNDPLHNHTPCEVKLCIYLIIACSNPEISLPSPYSLPETATRGQSAFLNTIGNVLHSRTITCAAAVQIKEQYQWLPWLSPIFLSVNSAIMDWFGRARVNFTHAGSPLALEERDGTRTDLLRVCEKATPPCQLNPLLFNGHLQTMWTAVKAHGPQIHYRRRIFSSDHKAFVGSFAVDFVVEPHGEVDDSLPPRTAYYSEEAFARLPSDDTRPMLIVLHGLSGGSHEIYLRHAIEPLTRDGRAWEICVVNSRGCANSEVTSGVLFNARATWDVRQVCSSYDHASVYSFALIFVSFRS